MAGHFVRLFNPHQVKQRRCDIGETSGCDLHWARSAGNDDRHVKGGVRGVRFACLGIAHHLDIAVIGGNQKNAARPLNGRAKPAKANVDRFHSILGGREDACVSDHVRIGVIHHYKIVLAGQDCGLEFFRDFECRHFRLLVVSGNLRAWD